MNERSRKASPQRESAAPVGRADLENLRQELHASQARANRLTMEM